MRASLAAMRAARSASYRAPGERGGCWGECDDASPADVAVGALILSSRMGSLAKPMGLSVVSAEELGRHFLAPIFLLLAFSALGWFAHFRRRAGRVFIAFALFPLLLFTLNAGVMEIVFNVKSARQMAQQIPALPPETRLAFLECFPSGLPFYLNRTATLFTKDGAEITSASNYILFRLKHEPAWPVSLVPSTNFDQWISGRSSPVYLVARDKNRARLAAIPGVLPADIQPLTPPYLGVLLTAP